MTAKQNCVKIKPLVFDLFCGLVSAKIEFCRCANMLIKELMASGAEYPNHVQFGILHLSPRPISTIFGTVGNFKHPLFAARLALLRQLGVCKKRFVLMGVGSSVVEQIDTILTHLKTEAQEKGGKAPSQTDNPS